MERELAPNAKSQHNPNSLYWYLQNMTHPAIYHDLANENLAISLEPGVQAVYPPMTTDQEHAQLELDQTFTGLKIAHLTYENLDQALIALIIPTIDPIYTSSIITNATLYHAHTVIDVLAYLYCTICIDTLPQ